MKSDPMKSPQKIISWPQDQSELWEAIREACGEQGQREHRRVSVSEWLRDAARRKLANHRDAPSQT